MPLLLFVVSVAILRSGPPPGFAGVLIERGYLPDAKPNAFAIGFSNGANFCYDPVRGGLNYAWSGGFVDVGSIRPGMGKTVAPVTLLGDVVYRERSETPWRVGRSDRAPAFRFAGYVIGDDRIEFTYTLDGIEVREEIRARWGGGLERRFSLSGDGGPVWFMPATEETLVVRGVVSDAGGYKIEGGGRREFSVEIVFGRAGR